MSAKVMYLLREASWKQIFITDMNNNCADYTFIVKFLSSPQNVLEALIIVNWFKFFIATAKLMFSSFLLNCNLNKVGTVKENLSPQGLGGKRNF